MSIKAILFDLDGTLLPMDQDAFTKDYFGRLAAWMAPRGYEPKKLIDAVWTGSVAMTKNDGTVTNEERFWEAFANVFGEQVRTEEPYLERFYIEQFDEVSDSCGNDPDAAIAVAALKADGYRLALATNPLFPSIATYKRVAWAGLDVADFEVITTYENSRYCKPSLEYYKGIADALGVDPTECLMVGNDVGEDMAARRLGMKVFLIPACLINRKDEDLSQYPSGDFADLVNYVRSL